MSLSSKDRVGSRIRCILLCELIKEDPEILTDLIKLPNVIVPTNPDIIPCSRERADELVFNKPIAEHFIEQLIHNNPKIKIKSYEAFKKEIEGWWFEHPSNANTPNWDLACIAEIDGSCGLVLVEAKAHKGELSRVKKTKSTGSDKSKENRTKIEKAIKEASKKLHKLSKLEFNLDLDSPYQLSNRFAWSWKLANLNIPIVLMYLGFIKAYEMGKDYFPDHRSVEICVKDICKESRKPNAKVYVSEDVWSNDAILTLDGIGMYSIIRSMELNIPKAEVKSINGIAWA